MIDLHCHILPGLDDGAVDLEDSVAMAAVAAADGIDVICATPHIRDDHRVSIAELATRVARLQDELDRRRIQVRIATGAEVAQTSADGLGDSELRQVSLGGSGRWILVEPAPGAVTDALCALVDRLGARGVRVVVAHPERHADPELEGRLRELVARGALVQWTAEFVANEDVALAFAHAGLVHLLGSDAHSSLGGRPVRLAAGFARLGEACTEAQLAWIKRDAPRAILRGESLSPPW